LGNSTGAFSPRPRLLPFALSSSSFVRYKALIPPSSYSWTSSIIYFGAIAAVFPTLIISTSTFPPFVCFRVNTVFPSSTVQKVPAGKYMAFNGAMWGVLLMASAAVKNYHGMLAVRFILGLFEAVIFAGMGLIVSMWWTRAEQPWRTAVYVLFYLFSFSFTRLHGFLLQDVLHPLFYHERYLELRVRLLHWNSS
jgi:hypothetical protein